MHTVSQDEVLYPKENNLELTLNSDDLIVYTMKYLSEKQKKTLI